MVGSALRQAGAALTAGGHGEKEGMEKSQMARGRFLFPGHLGFVRQNDFPFPSHVGKTRHPETKRPGKAKSLSI